MTFADDVEVAVELFFEGGEAVGAALGFGSTKGHDDLLGLPLVDEVGFVIGEFFGADTKVNLIADVGHGADLVFFAGVSCLEVGL